MKDAVKYLCEFIGTFILISVILIVGEPIPIAVALLVAIYMIGKVSGGHVNPVVSMSMFINNKISSMEFGGYIVSQFLGGLTAVYFAKMIKQNM